MITFSWRKVKKESQSNMWWRESAWFIFTWWWWCIYRHGSNVDLETVTETNLFLNGGKKWNFHFLEKKDECLFKCMASCFLSRESTKKIDVFLLMGRLNFLLSVHLTSYHNSVTTDKLTSWNKVPTLSVITVTRDVPIWQVTLKCFTHRPCGQFHILQFGWWV